jgi:hypothetical protein
MKTMFLRMAACLPLLAIADGSVLSGKVTDLAGKPLAGIWVGLAQAQVATLTGPDGSWSIGATGVLSRSGTRALMTRHLVREGGRLTVSLQDRDIFGRNLSETRNIGASNVAKAARTAADVLDTLLYVRKYDVLASTPVTSNPFAAGTVALDTATNWTYTTTGDTVVVTRTDAGFLAMCTGEAFAAHRTEPVDDTSLVRQTADGVEWTALNVDETYGPYQSVAKFHRLSGTPGSLLGRFQLVGEVYRTSGAISDSAKQAIADDSAFYARNYAMSALIMEFGAGTITQVGGNHPSFARNFVNDWNSPLEPWIYSAQDSVWVNYRQYSDSARYDIAVKIVDSNTVTLTGNVNQEVVTISAVATLSGFDRTFSSSDSEHTAGTSSAVPATCPDVVSWYQTFEWANFYQATTDPGTSIAGRKLVKSKALPVRHHHFF